MDINSLVDLMVNGDPQAQAARQAAALRNQQQFSQTVQGGAQQGQALNTLAFVANNANNPTLGKSVQALNENQQALYQPTKTDGGVYVPGTGDYAQSPGRADEKQDIQDTKRLQAAGLLTAAQTSADARQQAAQTAAEARQYSADQAAQARVLVGTIAAQGAADRAANSSQTRQAQQDMQQQRIFNTSEGRLGTLTRTTNLPAMMASSSGIVNRLQPYVDAGQANNIPGLTPTDKVLAHVPLPYSMTQSGKPGEAEQNIAMVKSAILDQLKTQVGLGGTNRARDEQLVETLSGARASSQDYINAYNNAIHPRLENIRQQALGVTASWTPDQWQQHLDAGGIDYRTPIPSIKIAPGKTSLGPKAPAAPAVDPDQALINKYLTK